MKARPAASDRRVRPKAVLKGRPTSSQVRRPARSVPAKARKAVVRRRPAASKASKEARRPVSAAQRRPAAAQAKVPRKALDVAVRRTRGSWSVEAAPNGMSGPRREGVFRFLRDKLHLVGAEGELLARLVLQPVELGAPSAQDAASGPKALPLIEVVAGEIIAEIQDPGNSGAFFVLPSQLNGAEYPSHEIVVLDVDHYRWDKTAGPRGQLAVHPAVGQFLLNNAANLERRGGISTAKELLKVMHKKRHRDFFLENGYLRLPWLQGEEAEAAVTALDQNIGELRTLAACDVPATGLSPDFGSWSEASHRVNLVYGSALPVDAYNNKAAGDGEVIAAQQKVSSAFLRGAYLGTLRLALEERIVGLPRTKVFLMPLGGGVFNNSREAIAQSMSDAIEIANDQLCGGDLGSHLDIRLLTYSGNPAEATAFSELLHDLGKLKVSTNSIVPAKLERARSNPRPNGSG